MAQARASTIQQEREEVYAALQYAASFHCLVEEWQDCEELKPQPKENWTVVDKKREETKHRTEWCAVTSRYRCMRCGRGRKYMKMKRRCTRPKCVAKNSGRWCERHMGGHDIARRLVDREKCLLISCRKCSGYARQKMGPGNWEIET